MRSTAYFPMTQHKENACVKGIEVKRERKQKWRNVNNWLETDEERLRIRCTPRSTFLRLDIYQNKRLKRNTNYDKLSPATSLEGSPQCHIKETST